MTRPSPQFCGFVLLAIALCVLFPPRKLQREPFERTNRGFLFSGDLYRDALSRDASVDLSHLALEVAFVLLAAGAFALVLPGPPRPRPRLHPRPVRTPNPALERTPTAGNAGSESHAPRPQ